MIRGDDLLRFKAIVALNAPAGEEVLHAMQDHRLVRPVTLSASSSGAAPDRQKQLRAIAVRRYRTSIARTALAEEERNDPPHPGPENQVFRAGRPAPRPQHRYRIHLRGRPPLTGRRPI
jgi:hypothetical protein